MPSRLGAGPPEATILPAGGAMKASASNDRLMARKPDPLAPLMAAVFGKKYRVASNDALANLPDPDNRKTTNTYVLRPVAATALQNGETIFVANAEVAGDDGRPMSAHASSGLLNVYVLRKEGGHWKVLRRHENIAALGSSGQIGEVVWVTLAPGKPGLGVLHGGTWQGAAITVLSLFDLGSRDMHELAAIKIHSDNDGGCVPESSDCWHVTGDWRFVSGKPGALFDDLLIDFSGEKSRRPGKDQAAEASGAERVSTRVHSAARYVFDGKRYRLASGANAVPEF